MTSTIRKIYKKHHHTVTLHETISFHLSSDDEDNETLRITTSIERAKKLVDTIFPENQKLQLIMILPDNFKKNILKNYYVVIHLLLSIVFVRIHGKNITTSLLLCLSLKPPSTTLD